MNTYERKNIQRSKEHVSSKNFTGPSTVMEADIVVYEFKESKEMYEM